MGKNTAKTVIDVDLSQVEAFGIALQSLSETQAMRVAVTALEQAARPMVQAIKARVPVRTGALRKSITHKVKGYTRSMKAVMMVGPSKARFLGGKRIVRGGKSLKGTDQPSKYAHLVEFGHHIPAGPDGSIGFSKAKGTVIDPSRRKSGDKPGRSAAWVMARPFMKPGVAAGTAPMVARLSDGIAVGLQRENKNILRKTRRLQKQRLT